MEIESVTASLPPGIKLGWGESSGLIEKIYCHEGVFKVDHQLPTDVETATLLRACGVGSVAVGEVVRGGSYYITGLIEKAADILKLPKLQNNSLRIPALMGWLCLSDSTLQCVKPVIAPEDLDERCVQTLTLLAEGKSWKEVATILGYSHRGLMAYFKDNYDQKLVTPRINTPSLLLHAYGANILDPEDVIARQGGERPQLPYVFYAKANRKLSNTRRQDKAMNNAPSNEPQSFRPFTDKDKAVWLTTQSKNHYEVTAIEACGKKFEVSESHILINTEGKKVPLTPREKLALLLLTLGASLEDIDTYCLEPAEFVRLTERLGVAGKLNCYAQATLMTCERFLLPQNRSSPRLEEDENVLARLREYARNSEAAALKRVIRHLKLIDQHHKYTLEDTPWWRGVNLMILLAHGDGRLG